MDLKQRIIIEIDPETEMYSVEFGQGEKVNLARAYAVLKTIVENIEDGTLLKNPGIRSEKEF